MIRLRSWLLLCCALAVQAAAAAEVVAPRLAYVQARDGLFELRIANPVTGASVRVQSLLAPPLLLIWSLDRPEVISLRDSGLYLSNYLREPGVATPVGDAAPAGLTVHEIWIGAAGGDLRAVASTQGRDARCALYAVPASGAWRRLDAPAPVAEQGGCQDFASAERASARSVSSAALARRQQCANPGSLCDALPGGAKDDYAAVRRSLFGLARGLEAVAIADPGATPYFLAVGVRIGETPHLADPVHLVARRDGRLQRPALRGAGPVQMGLAGPFALIATEYEGRDPQVVNLTTGRVVLAPPRASGAVWVP